MDDWQSPSNNSIIIIIVIILVIFAIIIIVIAFCTSSNNNNGNPTFQNQNINNNDDNDTPFNDGTIPANPNASKKSGTSKSTTVELPPTTHHSASNPEQVPAPIISNTNQVIPISNPVTSVVTSVVPVQSVPVQSVPSQANSAVLESSPIDNDKSGGSIPSSILLISGSNVSPNVSPNLSKDESFKISSSNLGSSKEEAVAKEAVAQTEEVKVTKNNDSLFSSSGSILSLEDLANHQDLASVEDVEVYHSNTSKSKEPSLRVGEVAKEPVAAIDVGADAVTTSVDVAKEVVTKELVVPVVIAAHSENIDSTSISSLPKDIIGAMNPPRNSPQPPRNSPHPGNRPISPGIKQSPALNGGSNIDETSGYSVDASASNPASFSSDFSSLTEKSGRGRSKKSASNPLAGIANFNKPPLQGRGYNQRMGPFQ